MRHSLIRHPQTPSAATGIEVEIATAGVGALSFRYCVTGKIDDLLIPEAARPVRVNELWRRTCFEAFLGSPGGAYAELNFSPSREWAAYRFTDYRRDMSDVMEMRHIDIAVQSVRDEFELRALVEIGLLPESAGAARLGLAAVIEERSGAKSYWALAHPPGKPDFHHQDNFMLELAGRTVR